MRPAVRGCIASTTKSRCLSYPPRRIGYPQTRNYSECPKAGPEPPSFHGYLLDALDAPLRSISSATRTEPTPTPPTVGEPALSDEEAKIAKARAVFRSRLEGPAERKAAIKKASTRVNGVLVPPRPEEPDNCCMSGCVNCVWDMFRDELEEWAAAKKEATERGMAAQGMDEDGGGSAMMAADTGAVEDLFEGIPVGIREFMKTEKKLKERLRAKETVAG